MESEVFNKPEAADVLGLSVRGLTMAMRDGRLPVRASHHSPAVQGFSLEWLQDAARGLGVLSGFEKRLAKVISRRPTLPIAIPSGVAQIPPPIMPPEQQAAPS